MISKDVVIITTKELEEVKNAAFQKGVERGRFEERSDRNSKMALNCANWKDGRCETCGVHWTGPRLCAQ